jgi:hypothetical protein
MLDFGENDNLPNLSSQKYREPRKELSKEEVTKLREAKE